MLYLVIHVSFSYVLNALLSINDWSMSTYMKHHIVLFTLTLVFVTILPHTVSMMVFTCHSIIDDDHLCGVLESMFQNHNCLEV